MWSWYHFFLKSMEVIMISSLWTCMKDDESHSAQAQIHRALAPAWKSLVEERNAAGCGDGEFAESWFSRSHQPKCFEFFVKMINDDKDMMLSFGLPEKPARRWRRWPAELSNSDSSSSSIVRLWLTGLVAPKDGGLGSATADVFSHLLDGSADVDVSCSIPQIHYFHHLPSTSTSSTVIMW